MSKTRVYAATWCLALCAAVQAEAGDPDPPEASGSVVRAVDFVLAHAEVPPTSYCCVYGAGEGFLAEELARRSEFFVFGVTPSATALETARARLDAAGLYGSRVLLQSGGLDPVRYRDYAAALVVSEAVLIEGQCAGSAAEMMRLVRPDGGMAIIGQPAGVTPALSREALESWLDAGGATDRMLIENPTDGLWAILTKGPLPGAGEWTHIWADPGNTACSGDSRTTDQSRILWFGEPGPKVLIDRHNRPHPPLYAAGRMIVPGDGVIICMDAYNGARLWEVEVPGSARVAVMRDAGWLTMDDEHVFAAAQGSVRKINLDTGVVEATWETPSGARDWGYVSVVGRRLYGSEQKTGASYIGPVGFSSNSEVLIAYAGFKPVICSETLFCRDRDTGELLWTYDNQSVIANPGICSDAEGMYFIESESASARGDGDGRVPLASFVSGNQVALVKIDPATGTVIWRKPIAIPFQHVIHLSCSSGMLLASGTSGSSSINYNLRAYRTSDGGAAWSRDLTNTGGSSGSDHGEQDKHAMIVGDKVILKFGSCYLATGNDAGFSFPTTSCADCSASLNHVYRRKGVSFYSGSPSSVNIATGAQGLLDSDTRPGCYISTIPAGGVIMLPAYSTGCTCYYTLQTTFVWLPE